MNGSKYPSFLLSLPIETHGAILSARFVLLTVLQAQQPGPTVVGVCGLCGRHGGSRANHDVHDAAWVALNRDGTRHYPACMMDDALVEIDTRTLAVARHFLLKKGAEHGATGSLSGIGNRREPAAGGQMGLAGDHAGHGTEPPKPGDVTCSPTWAQPSVDGSKVYVACNKSSDVVEIDVPTWTMTRRFPMGPGVYNLAASHDGKLLVGTNKRGQSVSIVDLANGNEIAAHRRSERWQAASSFRLTTATRS